MDRSWRAGHRGLREPAVGRGGHMRRRITVLLAVILVLGTASAARADNIGAAGDISSPPGGFRGDVATAALLAPESGNGIGLVLPLGDNQYQCGELTYYRQAYNQSWGRFLNITRPAPGTTNTS